MNAAVDGGKKKKGSAVTVFNLGIQSIHPYRICKANSTNAQIQETGDYTSIKRVQDAFLLCCLVSIEEQVKKKNTLFPGKYLQVNCP